MTNVIYLFILIHSLKLHLNLHKRIATSCSAVLFFSLYTFVLNTRLNYLLKEYLIVNFYLKSLYNSEVFKQKHNIN